MKNLTALLVSLTVGLSGCGAFQTKEYNQRQRRAATPTGDNGEVNGSVGAHVDAGLPHDTGLAANLVGPPPLPPEMLKMAPAVSTDFKAGPNDCTVSDAVLATYVSPATHVANAGSNAPSRHDIYCQDLWAVTLGQFQVSSLNGAASVQVANSLGLNPATVAGIDPATRVGNTPGFGPVAVGTSDPVAVNIVIAYKIPESLRDKFQFAIRPLVGSDVLVSIPANAPTLTATVLISLANLRFMKSISTPDAQGNFSAPFRVYAQQIAGTSSSTGPVASFPVAFAGVPTLPANPLSNIIGPPPPSAEMLKMAPPIATDFNMGPRDCTVSDAVLATYVSTGSGGSASSKGSPLPSKHDIYCEDLWEASVSQFHVTNINGVTPSLVQHFLGFGPMTVGTNDPAVINIAIDYKIPDALRGKLQFNIGFSRTSAITVAIPSTSVAIPSTSGTLTATLSIPLAKLRTLKAAAALDDKGNFSVPFAIYEKQIAGASPAMGPMAIFPVSFSAIPAPTNPAFPASISLDAQVDGHLNICLNSQGQLRVMKVNEQSFSFSADYVVSQNGQQTQGSVSGALTQQLPGDYQVACNPSISMVSWSPIIAGRTDPPSVTKQNALADSACIEIDDLRGSGAVHLVLNATTSVCP